MPCPGAGGVSASATPVCSAPSARRWWRGRRCALSPEPPAVALPPHAVLWAAVTRVKLGHRLRKALPARHLRAQAPTFLPMSGADPRLHGGSPLRVRARKSGYGVPVFSPVCPFPNECPRPPGVLPGHLARDVPSAALLSSGSPEPVLSSECRADTGPGVPLLWKTLGQTDARPSHHSGLRVSGVRCGRRTSRGWGVTHSVSRIRIRPQNLVRGPPRRKAASAPPVTDRNPFLGGHLSRGSRWALRACEERGHSHPAVFWVTACVRGVWGGASS